MDKKIGELTMGDVVGWLFAAAMTTIATIIGFIAITQIGGQ